MRVFGILLLLVGCRANNPFFGGQRDGTAGDGPVVNGDGGSMPPDSRTEGPRDVATTSAPDSSIDAAIDRGPPVNTYTIGTFSRTIDITGVTGAGPWTLQLAAADLSAFIVNDKITDEAATARAWKIAAIDDTADTITVIDSEGNGGVPSAAAVTRATVSRWFTTLQAWESARQGDLIARGVVEKGEMLKDSTFTRGVIIDGSTTDATHYMWLTAAPGHRHLGVAGTGVRIDPDIGEGFDIDIQDSYTKVEWLELTGFMPSGSTFGIGVRFATTKEVEINQVIVHDPVEDAIQPMTLLGFMAGASGTVRNSVFYNPDLDGYGVVVYGPGSSVVNIYNCVVYNVPGLWGITVNQGQKINAINTISLRGGMGSFCCDYGGGEFGASDFNLSDDAQAPGINSLRGKPATGRFVSTTRGSENFHLLVGADVINVGVDLSNSFTIDLDGEMRPKGGGWDVGPDEW